MPFEIGSQIVITLEGLPVSVRIADVRSTYDGRKDYLVTTEYGSKWISENRILAEMNAAEGKKGSVDNV